MAALDPASPGDPESGGGELHHDTPPPLPLLLPHDLQGVLLQLEGAIEGHVFTGLHMNSAVAQTGNLHGNDPVIGEN